MTMPEPDGRSRDNELHWRVAAAERLRRLGHALVAHSPPPAVLGRLVDAVDRLLPEVTAAPVRSDPFDFVSRKDPPGGDRSDVRPSGPDTTLFPYSVVSGSANPMSMGAVYSLDGNRVLARVVLGPAFEGAPGRAHGGILAAVMDETMGAVLPQAGTPAYTGTLNIRYLAPAPIGEELVFRAWIHQRSGRKLTIHAFGQHQDTKFAEAEAVFIAVADYLKRAPPESPD